ncbi:putative protease Do-like 14, partial [Mucuna pruriens]
MVGHFNRSRVVGAVAIAAFGSALLSSNNNNCYRALWVPVPLQFPDLTWPLLHNVFPHYLHSSHQSGMLVPHSYRVSPVPSSDLSKEASGDGCDRSKPCGCFGRDTIANAAAKVGPAVVYISVLEDRSGIYTGTKICSGTIINKDGTILTCAHIFDTQGKIGLSLGKVKVVLFDGRKFEGKVLNADLHSDIAIVKINSETPLPEAKLGSSSGLRPGDWVMILGSHLTLRNSITAGIVSIYHHPIMLSLLLCGLFLFLNMSKKHLSILHDIGSLCSIGYCCIDGFLMAKLVLMILSPLLQSALFSLFNLLQLYIADFYINWTSIVPFYMSSYGPRSLPSVDLDDSTILYDSLWSVFYKHSSYLCIYLVVYVNDTVNIGNDYEGIQSLKQHLYCLFEIKDLGSSLAQPEAIITISQRKHPVDILDETGVLCCKLVYILLWTQMSKLNSYQGGSGGPLVNMDGEVVGMAVARVADGFSFAIPIEVVCKITEHFKKSGPVSWSDMSKEASGAVCEGSKQHRCFGIDTISNAAAKVGPTVVSIAAPLDFFGIPSGTSTGTGTIINRDGTILTCARVVGFQGMIGSCTGKVEVTLQDGRTFEGKVLNADPHSNIAIVKINSETPLPEAKIGSSSRLCPGDWVIAMGCPLTLKNTVTAGIVSCINRRSIELGFTGMSRAYIQTDCACDVGYSGGPLFNMDGELVGVDFMKVDGANGLSFSQPIDFVCEIIEHLKKNRYRMIRHFNRSRVVGAVAITAFGSTLLSSNNNNCYGISALDSYRITSSDISTEASGAVCDGSKPHVCFGRDTIANAAAKILPAVVSVEVQLGLFGMDAGTNLGSGTIINKDGTILTCARLVDCKGMIRSCKGKVEVTLHDGRTFEGKVLNVDGPSDIAIVKINSETPLPEAKIGSSSGLCPGDWVISIGCPHTLKNTVTAGTVSCIGCKSSDLGFSGVPREYLQTSCPYALENSGGPLVNMDGEVVGVNIMQVWDDDGLSFSLPIEFVCKIIEHLKKSSL